jgi:hypothetical protein
MPTKPKLPVIEAVPEAFAQFMRDVVVLIDAGDAAAWMESDDLLQCERIYGGLYDAELGRYGFTYFANEERGEDEEFDVCWELDFDRQEIRDIASGKVTRTQMWRCESDCGRRFSANDGYCPACDSPTPADNLQRIGWAMYPFAKAHGHLPPRAIFKDGKPVLSWRVALLPYVEQKPLYDQFRCDEPWDSDHNRALIEKIPPAYVNPQLDASLSEAGLTNYLVPAGRGTLFDGERGARITDIKDGLSYTLLLVEANADRAVIWTKPDDLEIDPAHPLRGLGQFHSGYFRVLCADGCLHAIQNTIDAKTLANLFNPNDGEVASFP